MECFVTLIDFVNNVELNGEAGFASTKKLNTQYSCYLAHTQGIT